MAQLIKNKVDKVDVSIIIPAKNEAKNIEKCLKAVFNQESPFAIEVIVIDSGSKDQTIALVKKYPLVRLITIPSESFGHGKTRNLGAQQSKGEYLVFLNADAIPADHHWLTALLHPFRTREKLAGVFSRHLPKPGCHLYMARDLLKSMPEIASERQHTGVLDFMIFSTVSCAIPRKLWEHIPFENEIIIAEDQKWGRQVLEHGYIIRYEPQSIVFHSHNYLPRQLFEIKQKVGSAENKFKYKFNAAIFGFLFMVAGIKTKVLGDIIFILFKNNSSPKLSFKQKLKEITIAFKARMAGFAGRYKGWLM